MKSPLRYQITEYDNGAVSLLNCLSYLFEREEMPSELVRVVSIYSLDTYDKKGKLDVNSSRNVVFSVARWMDEFALQKNIPLKCVYLKGEDASVYALAECLKNGGCVNVKTYRDGEKHYVMVVAVDDEFVYMFDPYFESKWDYRDSKIIQVVDNNPFAYNRKVSIEHFLSNKKQGYSLGPEVVREIALFTRVDVTQEREFV